MWDKFTVIYSIKAGDELATDPDLEVRQREGFTMRRCKVSLNLTPGKDSPLISCAQGLKKVPLDSKKHKLPNLDALTKISVL